MSQPLPRLMRTLLLGLAADRRTPRTARRGLDQLMGLGTVQRRAVQGATGHGDAQTTQLLVLGQTRDLPGSRAGATGLGELDQGRNQPTGAHVLGTPIDQSRRDVVEIRAAAGHRIAEHHPVTGTDPNPKLTQPTETIPDTTDG